MSTATRFLLVSLMTSLAAPAAATAAAPCDAPTRAEKRRLKRAVLKGYQVDRKVKVNVAFPSCLRAADPNRIVVESGAGHGGWMRLDELRVVGDRYQITSIEWQGYYLSGSVPVVVRRGEVSRRKLARAVRDSRILLEASVTEKAPDLHLSGWMSSGDFRAHVEVQGAVGKPLVRGFTGYMGSQGQPRYAPVVRAVARLLMDTKTLKEVPIDDDARRFFGERFGRRHYLGGFQWWVHERMLLGAKHLGTLALGNDLIEDAERKVEKGGIDRSQHAALAALAAITGKDLRHDAKGKERPLRAVAHDYRLLLGATEAPQLTQGKPRHSPQ